MNLLPRGWLKEIYRAVKQSHEEHQVRSPCELSLPQRFSISRFFGLKYKRLSCQIPTCQSVPWCLEYPGITSFFPTDEFLLTAMFATDLVYKELGERRKVRNDSQYKSNEANFAQGKKILHQKALSFCVLLVILWEMRKSLVQLYHEREYKNSSLIPTVLRLQFSLIYPQCISAPATTSHLASENTFKM
jgi:hypothetical protein